jgi:hypothetical protein
MSEKDPYYDIDCLSASRLGVVKCLRDGTEMFKSGAKAKAFGRQIHQAALEPEKYELELISDPSYRENKFKIIEMIKALKDNHSFNDIISSPGLVEYNHFFKEERYGLECKIKMDKFLPDIRTIFDLKSTSAKTLKEFMESIETYGYHRQGAFYLDGTTCNRFTIIGVSKTSPHKTFTVPLSYNHELIVKGRKEYEDLIDYYISMEVKPDFKLLMAA